jgi:TMEM175 potassium channel family protein
VGKGRFEAFSDGVIAIIITILVLELKVPEGSDLHAIEPLRPVFLTYILSFVYIGIYWNNHHHMLHATNRISGASMWANLHLLFWLSLVPFVTGWMGANLYEALPAAAYGTVLLMAAVAYTILQTTLTWQGDHNAALARAIKRDVKGKISVLLYLTAIPLAFVATWAAIAIYVVVALIWLVPDRRIERVLAEHHEATVGSSSHH